MLGAGDRCPGGRRRRERAVLVLNGAQIEALASSMADLSSGRASAPDRVAALVPEQDGMLAAMIGYVPSAGALMTKLLTLYPRNTGPQPTHQAVIVMFDQ